MKMIKSWYCLCGPRYKNFGDKLTKILIEYLTKYRLDLVPHTERERCELLGIGSILHVFHPYSTGTVWTTGFMQEYQNRNLTNSSVVAVRGKLSLKRIKTKDNSKVILGDGGLICDVLVNKIPPKKYKLGIIPHYVDQEDPYVQELIKSSDIKFIDVCAEHMEVINTVLECDYVLSSSLHGLILADSLNVPNDWIELSNKVHGNGFKFRDYYSAFNIKDKIPYVIKNKTEKTIIGELETMNYQRPGIKEIKEKLLKITKNLEL